METLPPAQWLAKAQEAREYAAVMRDAGARHTMLMIAAGYEKMAEHAALFADLLKDKISDL